MFLNSDDFQCRSCCTQYYGEWRKWRMRERMEEYHNFDEDFAARPHRSAPLPDVRIRSKADIEVSLIECPLYPPKADTDMRADVNGLESLAAGCAHH